MRPVLFSVGSFLVHSYYLLWTVALSMAVVLTRRRMNQSYGVNDDDARFIIVAAFIGMIFGARIGSVIEFRQVYIVDPFSFFRFWEGGFSAVPAFLGAGGVGVWASWKKNVPVWMTADGASIPAAFALAVGRWGCFLNGCCGGIETNLPWGVRFSTDTAGLLRHPTQLYYAFGALLISALLQRTENVFLSFGEDRRVKGAVLWPMFMMLYSLLRLVVDPLRVDFYQTGLQMTRLLFFAIFITGALWCAHSFYRKKEWKNAE